MREKRGKKFGLKKKLILFITILAIVTYTTSGLFINIVQPQFFPKFEPFWFAGDDVWNRNILVRCVSWHSFSTILTKPLQNLEKAANKSCGRGNRYGYRTAKLV